MLGLIMENKQGQENKTEKDSVPIEFPPESDVSEAISTNVVERNDTQALSTNVLDRNDTNVVNVQNTNQQLVMQISNVNSLHLGSVYNINNAARKENNLENTACGKIKGKQTSNVCRKTTSIDLMMKSKDKPSRKLLESIATHLGIGWRQVMRELGFSEGQISNSELDNHIYGTKEVVYQLLLDWSRNADEELNNTGYLTKLLWNCGYRECVYRIKSTWKSESEKNS